MPGLLTVTTPATARALTTREAVRAELGDITVPDARLDALILAASAAVEGWCGRVFARETLQEVFRPDGWRDSLILSRTPVAGTPTVTEDGTALALNEDYEMDARAGLLWRLSGDRRVRWCAGKVVLSYSAGFLLPGQAGEDLPPEVNRAAAIVAAAAVHAAGRDPTLRSTSTEGVGSDSYLDPRAGMEALPPQAVGLIQPWRGVAL